MRETKTVQVYPSDSIVNATIEEYGSFGWEVLGNQRFQEYEGQTHDYYSGNTTRHYSSFNKITFTREKNVPWYGQVTQLEKEYFAAQDTIEHYKYLEPELRELKPRLALGIFLYGLYIIPGIIFSIVRACKKSKYRKQYSRALASYRAKYPAKIAELKKRKAELRAAAEQCIFGQRQAY